MTHHTLWPSTDVVKAKKEVDDGATALKEPARRLQIRLPCDGQRNSHEPHTQTESTIHSRRKEAIPGNRKAKATQQRTKTELQHAQKRMCTINEMLSAAPEMP